MNIRKNIFWYVLVVSVLALLLVRFLYPSNQLLLLVVIAFASVLVIMKSAGYMISSISDYAHQTGLSDYLLGFVIVAVCTSLPELSTAVFASLAEKGALILGDVIGANLVDTTLVLGLMVIFGRKLKVGGKRLSSIAYLPLALLVFGFDGKIGRLEGGFLLLFFAAYLFVLIMQETEKSKLVKDIKFSKIWRDILVFGFSLAALLLAARWMVFSAVSIAGILHIPHFVMGLIVIALITTIPELVVSLKSVFSGVRSVAFGNIFGSFATNICLVIGIAALINPITFDRMTFFISFGFMSAAISLSLFFMRGKYVTWKEGAWLIVLYLVFLVSQIVMGVV